MCIRDSYQQAQLQIDELKQFRSFPSRLTGHGESHLFPEAVLLSNGPLGCLLYTSDAADERSSVDLGGRRIIKKKTKSIIYW